MMLDFNDQNTSELSDLHQVLAGSRLELLEVTRTRLLETLIERIQHQRFTHLQGPAGSGKSVLLKQLSEAATERWSTVLLDLESLSLPAGGVRALLLPHLARLSRARGPFVMLIDSVDVLRAAERQALAEALVSLPPQGRVLVVSRGALPQLRATQLDWGAPVVSFADLLLSPEELPLALTDHGQPLNAARLLVIWRFTQGWPALLALLCASDPSDSVLDIQRLLLEWFEEEVLQPMEPGLRDFLLDASAAQFLDPGLLDAMRGQPGSALRLRSLAREQALLLREGQALPRALLYALRHLHWRRDPQRVRELHRAALETLLDQQQIVAALEHAWLLGDAALLIRLLQQHGQRLVSDGRMRAMARWLGGLYRQGYLQDAARLQVLLAWSLLFTEDQNAAMDIVRRLRDSAESALRDDLEALELTWLSMRDRMPELLVRARAWRPEQAADSFAQGVHQCSVALAWVLEGNFGAAAQVLSGVCNALQGRFVSQYAAAIRAMMALFNAAPQQAHDSLQSLAADPRSGSIGNSLIATLQAYALYEMGHGEQARLLLEMHMPVLRYTGLLDQIIMAYKFHARILLAQGASQQAQANLAALECLGRDKHLPRLVFSAQMEQVRCALVRGDSALARQRLDGCRQQTWAEPGEHWYLLPTETDSWLLMDVRVRLAQQDADGLVESLTQALDQALETRRLRRALTLRVLLALALEQRGNEHAALRMMQTALEFAQPRQLLQALCDEGHAALGLAVRCVALAPELGGFVEQLTEGRELALETARSSPLDSLTGKERQVLALLASGQTNDAMASMLFVSESTVRTHLRSINAKLGAKSRLEALAIARSEGLIAP